MACSENHRTTRTEQSMSDFTTGAHEVQIEEGYEYNLQKHVTGCHKNPGHKKFIPVDTFNLLHLPTEYRKKIIYNLIKATAYLTVRLEVHVSSRQRPEFYPLTSVPYPNYEIPGRTRKTYGSGRVTQVSLQECKTCPCRTCAESDTPSQNWWRIYVETAAHVVIDDDEASHTSARLFYDNERDSVLVIDGFKIHDVDVGCDRSRMYCVTCDVSVARQLSRLVKKPDKIQEQVHFKFSLSHIQSRFMFIVSHPHGCSKQISVGQWKDVYQEGEDIYDHKFTYTTATCPGSSGGAIYFLGYYGGVWWFPMHSGTLPESGLNYSNVCWVGR